MISLDDLTLAEVEQLEEAARCSLASFEDPKAPKGRLMRAIAFIAKRRDDPGFTWDQAGQLTMSDLDALVSIGGDDAVDPPVPPPSTGSAPSSP